MAYQSGSSSIPGMPRAPKAPSFGGGFQRKAPSNNNLDLNQLLQMSGSQGPNIAQAGGNFLKGALDLLDRPRNAIASAVQSAAGQSSDNPFDAFIKGLTGQNHVSYGDILKKAGVTGPAANIGGFAGDVILDPLNLVGLGEAAKAVKVGEGVGKVALNGAGRDFLQKALAQGGGDVVKTLGEDTVRNNVAKLISQSPELYNRFVDKGGIKIAGQSIIPGKTIANAANAAANLPVIGKPLQVANNIKNAVADNFKVGNALDRAGGERLHELFNTRMARAANADDLANNVANSFKNGLKQYVNGTNFKKVEDVSNAIVRMAEEPGFRDQMLSQHPELATPLRAFQSVMGRVAKNETQLRADTKGAGLLENYRPHLFKEDQATVDRVISDMERRGKMLSPQAFFLKHRAGDNTVQQIVDHANQMGIKLTPLNAHESIAARLAASEKALANHEFVQGAKNLGVVANPENLASPTKNAAKREVKAVFQQNKQNAANLGTIKSLGEKLGINRENQAQQLGVDEQGALANALLSNRQAASANNTVETAAGLRILDAGRQAAQEIQDQSVQKEVRRLMSQSFKRSSEGKDLLQSLGLKNLTKQDAETIARDQLTQPHSLFKGITNESTADTPRSIARANQEYTTLTRQKNLIQKAIGDNKVPTEKQLTVAKTKAESAQQKLAQQIGIAKERQGQARLGMVGNNEANSPQLNRLLSQEKKLSESQVQKANEVRSGINSSNQRLTKAQQLFNASENINHDFGVAQQFKNANTAVANGWTEPGIPQLKGVLFPSEQAKALTQLIDDSTYKKAGPLLGYLDKAMGFYKGMVTQPFGSFHLRNKLGNLFNGAYLGGVGLSELPQYMKYQKDVMTGAKQIVSKTGRTFTPEELQKLGVMGSGQAAQDAKSMLNPITHGRQFGTWVENPDRVALFMNRIDKGDSVPQAVAHVNKFLFNYGNQTKTVRNIGRFVPFFTWTANNIPLQLEQMMKQPSKFNHLYQAFQEAGGNSPDMAALPSYTQNGLQAEIGSHTDSNNNKIISVMSRLGLPAEDLEKLYSGSVPQTLEQTGLASLAPYLQLPAEIATQQDFYRGMSFKDAASLYGNKSKNLPQPIKDWLGYKEETYTDKQGVKHTIPTVDPQKYKILESSPFYRFFNIANAGNGKNPSTGQDVNTPMSSRAGDILKQFIVPASVSDYNVTAEQQKRDKEAQQRLIDYLVQQGVLKQYTNTYKPKNK